MPHVTVAQRLKLAGKLEKDNNFIKYVICKAEKKEGQTMHLGDKAFSPEEVMDRSRM